MSAVRAGLVGVGKMGLSHLAILGANPQVNVAAICDSAGYMTGPLRKNTNLDLQTYKSVDEMLKHCELDCVVISTPTATHYSLAKQALGHGLHVFVEKPLCLDPAQSRELAELAEAKGLITQVGYHNRFIGTFREAREVIAGGTLGKIYHIDGSAFGQVVVRPKTGRTWRSKKTEGGGCLHDYACHVLDLMNYLLGPPDKVKYAHLKKIYSAEIEDAVYAGLAYPSGASGYLETNWSDDSYRKMTTAVTVYGDNGKLTVDRQELRVYLKAPAPGSGYQPGWTVRYITELQQPVAFYLRGEEYTAQLDNFIGAIRGGDNQDYSFASAAATDEVIGAILERSKED